MKRIALIAVSLCLLISSSVWAEGLSLGLFANNRVVGTEVGVLTSSPYGTVELAGGLTYNKDRYTITSGVVSVKSDSLSPGLRYGLGFKYVMGSMKSTDRSRTGDLSALGFNAGLSYELPATLNPSSIPVELSLYGTLSPNSISFDETESYHDYTAGIRLYIMANAYMALTHTYVDAEFSSGGVTWDRYVNETMLGVVLTL